MAKKKKEHSSAPKLGAQYQAAKLGVQIAGPPALRAITDKKLGGAEFMVRQRNYQKGVLVSLLDHWGSKKIHHAAALSRKSVTAIAPEAYATAGSAFDSDFDPQTSYALAQARTSGFNPQSLAFQVKGADAQTYFFLKYGGWAARKILTATRLNTPINKFLGMLGVTQ